MAIESFRHKGLKRLYDADDASKLPADMLARIRLILTALDAAETIRDMEQPTFRLHQLKGSCAGFGQSPFAPIGALHSVSRLARPQMSILWTTIRDRVRWR